MKTTTFTVQNLIDAAKKNGYEWRGLNTDPAPSRERKYCVLEQAALNSYLPPYAWAHLAIALDDIGISLGSKIFRYNDHKAKSYEDAANYLEEILTPYADKEITIEHEHWWDHEHEHWWDQ